MPNETTDLRLRLLSYSSQLDLHSCPRKFQLYRCSSERAIEDTEADKVTFDFGHVVGDGVVSVIAEDTWDTTVMKMLMSWKGDLLSQDVKRKKSFWETVYAVQQFKLLRDSGFLDEYELYYHNDKPAVELSFVITTPDGFRQRGFFDAVLKHKHTGALVVLELKTTAANNFNEAMYKNSSQGVGYSVVLDVIAPGYSAYSVLYLVYRTTKKEYVPIICPKTAVDRANWLTLLVDDMERIMQYQSQEDFPPYGESCYHYGRECKYYGVCGLATDALIQPWDEAAMAAYKEKVAKEDATTMFSFPLSDVIERQITNNTEGEV